MSDIIYTFGELTGIIRGCITNDDLLRVSNYLRENKGEYGLMKYLTLIMYVQDKEKSINLKSK